jgi:hypothetical protein
MKPDCKRIGWEGLGFSLPRRLRYSTTTNLESIERSRTWCMEQAIMLEVDKLGIIVGSGHLQACINASSQTIFTMRFPNVILRRDVNSFSPELLIYKRYIEEQRDSDNASTIIYISHCWVDRDPSAASASPGSGSKCKMSYEMLTPARETSSENRQAAKE